VKMKLDDLGKSLETCKLIGDGSIMISGLAFDSRSVKTGDLFCAIRGEQHDGFAFAQRAIKSGAVALITEGQNGDYGNGCLSLKSPLPVPVLLVKNARRAMAQAARVLYGDPAKKMHLLGVTGTNGKTTTAYLVRHILNTVGLKCGMTGTIEYDLGAGRTSGDMTTPESLQMYEYFETMQKAGCQACISEVSSHALAKSRVEGLNFTAAAFTNLTQDHLDFHKDMESYFETKASLFSNLAKSAQAVINIDDKWGRKLPELCKARIISFGLASDADLCCQNLQLDLNGARFDLLYGKHKMTVISPLLGNFNVSNVLAAIGLAIGAGADIEAAATAVADFPGVPGRMESIKEARDFRVLVDYAHTEAALNSVLSCLRNLNPSRIITVFGCGGDRDRSKRPKMAQAAEAFSDQIIVTSDNPRTENPDEIIQEILNGLKRPCDAVLKPDRACAINKAITMAAVGDVVLIAGKGHEDYQILGQEKIHFDDRQEARKALALRYSHEV
jgi:UDP-N-acetylmuramoyl-L-alanyl-D-glutamate--2,6-diaminopimelate ligase